MTDPVKKKYRVYETHVVEKEIQYCEDCDFSSYTYDGSRGCMCAAICNYHQRYLESEKDHIPIPDWCKIEQIPFPLTGRNMR